MAVYPTAKASTVLAVFCCAVRLHGQDLAAVGSDSTPEWQAGSARCPTTIKYYHHDATGNLWAVSDASATVVWRAEVWPFGQGLATSSDTAQRFLDEPRVDDISLSEGVYHLGVRTHDPLSGRFLTTDPLSLTLVPLENPQQFNRFSYGLNNPDRFSDLSGAQPVDRRIVESSSARNQDKGQENPIESRKVTKIPIIIINDEGETPLSLLTDPNKARKAILKAKEGDAPLPEEARRAVESARLQVLLRQLGDGGRTREILDKAKKRSGDARTLKRPKLTIPAPSPLTLCNCKLQPTKPPKKEK